jgi:Ribonuclease G/E
MVGEVGILNVGAGDTKLSFDPKKPKEVERASRIVKDMLRRGYAILVEVGKDEKGPLYRRATDFDAKTAEYIIIGEPEEATPNVESPSSPPPRGKAGRKTATNRVPAASTNAVAVARTAGG